MTNIPLKMVSAKSWKKNDAIKIKRIDIKLVRDTMLVIKSVGKKIKAQIKKNAHYNPG